MKRIILFFSFFVTMLCFKAQTLPFETMGENMHAYYEGCVMLNHYIQSKDREDLTAALGILNPKKLEVSYFEPEVVDSTGLAPIGTHFRYDYAYALALFNDMMWEDQGLSRGISACTVKLLALKPNGQVKFCTSGCDDFYLFTVAEPHARVVLSVEEVESGTVHEGTPLEDGTVSFVSWNQPEESDLIITIKNTSDKEVSLTLASQSE